MPTVVEIPDVGPIEFPDEMDDVAIGKAIREDVYKLPALPDMPEYDERTYRERRFLAESNLRMADEDLARLEAGTAQVQDEAMKAQAAQVLSFARTRRDMALADAEAVGKDPAPFGKSAQASLASGALNTAAAGADVVESFAPPTGEPARPEDSNQYSKLAGEKERLLADFNKPGPDGVLSEAVMRPRMQRLEEINRELEGIERPRSESLSGQLAGAAAQAFENANINPAATNTAAQIGRGVGTFASMAPTVFMGSVGLPAAVLQMGGETYQRGYTQKEQELRASGMADEAQIADEASKFATTEAIKAAPAFAAYLVGGKLASHLVAKALPAASPLQKTLAGTVAGTGANVLVGGAVRAAHGENFIPNAEQLTQDVLWGVVHGAGEGRRAAGERKLSREEPTIEQPNAEQISETSAPDGGVRPRSELQEMPAPEGGEGIQPIRSGERLAEGPRVEAPEAVGEPLRQPGTEGGEAMIASGERNKRNLGPGAANIEEFAPLRQIAAYNAAVDKQRADRGLEPLMSEARKADPVTWENAERRIEADPEYPAKLVEDINEGKKTAVNDEEQSALLWRMIDLRTRREGELQRAADEFASPEERAQAKVDYDALGEQLSRTEEADRKSGTMQGRALRIRRLLANEDFTVAGMMRRAEVAKGSDLTPAERAKVQRQSEEAQRTNKAYEERVRKLEEDQPVDAAIKEIEARASQSPDFTPEVRSLADRIVARLDTAATNALQRLRSKFGQANVGADPTILADLVIYGSAKIAKGLVKFTKWSTDMVREFGDGVKPYLEDAWKGANKRIDDAIAGTRTKKPKEVKEAVTKEKVVATADSIGVKMKARVAAGDKLSDLSGYVRQLTETLVRGGIKQREPLVDAVHEVLQTIDPNITRRQAMDAISGYGDFKPLNKDAVKAEVRDLKGQLQQVAKLEDIESKKPLQKTGVERRLPSDEERRLIAQVNDAKKKFGVVVTDPETQLKGALDAIETRLENQIKDITRQIETGESPRGRTPAPTNDRIEQLRGLRDRVRSTLEELRGKPEMTTEQRVQVAKRGLEASIADLERRIARGDTSRTTRPEVKSAELDALRSRREALRAELDELRTVDSSIAEDRKFDAAMKSAEALEKKLAAADLSVKGKTLGPDTEMVTQAKKRLAALRKEMQERRKALNPPKPEEQRKLEAAMKAVEKSIAEYDRRLAAGDLSARSKAAGVSSPELEVRRAERDVMRDLFRELQDAAKPKLTPEERAMKALKTRLAKQTADLQERIATEAFSPRPKREPIDISRDPEAIRLKAENERVKREFERERLRFERARRTLPQKAVAFVKEAFNLPRTFLSSFDVSAVLRQGGFITYGNPVRAARAVGTMLKALVSQRAAERTEQQILARPNAPLYQRAKLYIAPLDDAKLSRQEESIMSELANRLPGIKASNRAYVTFLNKMRADTFDAMKATLEKQGVPLSQAELEAIANYINVATGRGNLGKAAPAAETLATFFFSPRLLVSRFQLLLGQPFKGGSARTRKAVATEYAKLLLGLSAVYALGTMAGADVEADPRSSDFGKLRFGDTRVDPLMGLAQATVLLSRVGTGEAKGPSGKIVDIRGDKKPFGTGGTAEVIGRFLRTKLSPVLGSAVDIAADSNVIGEEVTPSSAATGLLVPLSFRDIATVMDEQGVPRGTALEILNLFGMGLQHFEDRKR